MSNKEALKEKLKQALSSTVRVISDDLELSQRQDKNKSSKKFDFFEIDNLAGPRDFVRLRAESDSTALKKKFSDDLVFKKNLPTNSSCKSLYTIAEKIRYEQLGTKMLKGIEKNLNQNYEQIINLKEKINLRLKKMFQ